MTSDRFFETRKGAGGAVALQCPVCGASAAGVFWRMNDLPVRCNVLCDSREEALATPRGDIELAVCRRCAYIWNAAFEPGRMTYDQAYENSLHFSPRFQDYAEGLADRLIERHSLRNKDVIEIACGQGDFLRLICERGDNRGVGFDPSYVPDATTAEAAPAVAIIADYYDSRFSDRRADLICCRHALEHIPDPVGFLGTVRAAIGERDTVAFFEVPNVEYTLRDLGIWDIIYEHCSYFCRPALVRCFAQAGFAVEAATKEYEGQFLTIEGRVKRGGDAGLGADAEELRDVLQSVDTFDERFGQKLATWKQQLEGGGGTSERVVVWGSGSKGVTFLNVMNGAAAIEFVVDINPRKEGRFVVGTGQRIVRPEFLREYRPDRVLVMNPIYELEIRGTLASMGLDAVVQTA